jgi:hypothetical protein
MTLYRFSAYLVGMLVLAMPVHGGPLAAAESTLADKALKDAVGLPRQMEQSGTEDFLLELRAERPGSTLLVLTHFPQGFSEAVDSSLALFAGALHSQGYADVRERGTYSYENYMAKLAKESGGKSGKEASAPVSPGNDWANTFADSVTYVVYRPSERFATILFRQDSSGGGAHGSWVYHAVSFDLQSGRPVSVKDLFPKAQGLDAVLGPRVLEGLKALGGNPRREQEESGADLIGMERLILTPEGLRVVYAPYEAGSYAEGEFLVDIPKQEALSLGANPAVWMRQ